MEIQRDIDAEIQMQSDSEWERQIEREGDQKDIIAKFFVSRKCWKRGRERERKEVVSLLLNKLLVQ